MNADTNDSPHLLPFPGSADYPTDPVVRELRSVRRLLRRILRHLQPRDEPRAVTAASTDPEPDFLHAVQVSILTALQGHALRTDALVERSGYAQSTVFKHLPELIDRGRVRHSSKVGYYRPDALPPELVFIPTPFQRDVLTHLNGKALRVDALCSKLDCPKSRLYQEPGGLKELEGQGRLAYHPRLGYYRPDAPPPELTAAMEPAGHDTPPAPPPLTKIQKAILQALDGKALSADALALRVDCHRRTLYRPNALPALRQLGLVDMDQDCGYFRPDARPPEIAATASTEAAPHPEPPPGRQHRDHGPRRPRADQEDHVAQLEERARNGRPLFG